MHANGENPVRILIDWSRESHFVVLCVHIESEWEWEREKSNHIEIP